MSRIRKHCAIATLSLRSSMYVYDFFIETFASLLKLLLVFSQKCSIHLFASLTLVRKLLKTKIETNCVEHCEAHLSLG